MNRLGTVDPISRGLRRCGVAVTENFVEAIQETELMVKENLRGTKRRNRLARSTGKLLRRNFSHS